MIKLQLLVLQPKTANWANRSYPYPRAREAHPFR
jgi:hypothetical protein